MCSFKHTHIGFNGSSKNNELVHEMLALIALASSEGSGETARNQIISCLYVQCMEVDKTYDIN